MTYPEAVHFLFSQLPVFQNIGASAYKPGLDNVRRLADTLGVSYQGLAYIHVGGTNGKGSTSHTLAAVLQEQGHKVGLYTSPHLLDFRERIRINGQKVSEEYVIDFVQRYIRLRGNLQPSFFELTTVMALGYFSEQEVDYAVVEVGLGGRLDSTNIITPILSVITNISRDHTQYLGESLSDIASEKAGIIKPLVPVVIGESSNADVRAVFQSKADELQSPIIFAEDNLLVSDCCVDEDKVVYQSDTFPHLEGDLRGYAQLHNANTILTAISILRKLGIDISECSIRNGMRNVCGLTGLMGRWQQLLHTPTVICDTAHNVAGVDYIVQQLQAHPAKRLHIVWGMVADKDIDAVLSLLPCRATYYFCRAEIARALPEESLQKRATDFGLHGNRYISVAHAVEAAMKEATSTDMIFIGGSTFVVAEALSLSWERW